MKSMKSMKSMKIILLFIIVLSYLFSANLYSGSYYYFEDFSTAGGFAPEWTNFMAYGRGNGVVLPSGAGGTPSDITITGGANGVLRLTGTPNDGDGVRNGYWVGRYVFNTNKFYATSSMPFGFESIRTHCLLDYKENDNSVSDSRRRCSTGIWLFEDKDPAMPKTYNYDRTYEWKFLKNTMQFANEVGVWTSTRIQKIMYCEGPEVDIITTTGVRPDGRLYTDPLNRINHDFDLQNNDSTPQAANGDVGFRMVHDGDRILFYANPDADNNDSEPNEWILLDSKQVAWYSNMQFMIGHAQKANNDNSGGWPYEDFVQDADWDDVLVRSASDKTTIGFDPPSVQKSTNYQWLTMILTNDILTDNAGINYIRIIKPSAFQWYTNIAAGFVVRTHYDNTTNERILTTQIYQYDTFPNTGEVDIMTNFGLLENKGEDEIRLILGDQIAYMTNSMNIEIDMLLLITNEFFDAEFEVYVMAEQFDDGPKDQYSTCGWQKSSGSATLYKSLSDANGNSSITPTQIIQGSDEYAFTYYIRSGNIYSEHIKQAAIIIPSIFVVKTNTIDSFLLNEAPGTITITTNSAIAGTNNIILIDYDNESRQISAGGGMDIITFKIYGNTEKGSHQWACRVDGNVIDGGSSLTTTNAIFPSQGVAVLGAPPNVAAGITSPSKDVDKIALFNTLSTYTLEYTIENRADESETDNKIQIAVITNPGIFTNIQLVDDKRLSIAANIVIDDSYLPNFSVMTLYYQNEPGTGPIPPQSNDIVRIQVMHNVIPPNSTNVFFSCIVDNSNGVGFYKYNVDLVNKVFVTDPYPLGKVDCHQQSGVIYTSDITNTIEYKIFNDAVTGKIYEAEITIPTNYFTHVTNITSSKGATNISVSNLIIHVTYSTGFELDIGEVDTITFDVVNKYTNYAVPIQLEIESRVFNPSKTNNTSHKDTLLGLDRYLNFVPQEARVRSYITNNNLVNSEVTTSTLYYVFENYGDPGNVIQYAEGLFSGALVTNLSVTGSISGVWDVSVTKFSNANYNLQGGQKDILTIIINDGINVETTRDIIPLVTVNTSIKVSTEKPVGKTNIIIFKIPSPVAKGGIYPKEMFNSAIAVTNFFTYNVYNDGDGSNDLEKVVIIFPDFLNGMVTAISNSWMTGTANITSTSTNVVIDYAAYGTNLYTKGTDNVLLRIIHNTSIRTDVVFELEVENNDGKGLYSTTDLDINKTLSIAGQPDGYIKTPTSIESASSSNIITYRIKNNDKGKAVLGARIQIPTGFTVNLISVSGSWPSVSYAVSNNYLWASYITNDLDAGGYDEIVFTVNDSYSKTNASFNWSSEVMYKVGGIYYGCATNLGSPQLNINFTSASVDSYLTPNQALVNTVTNSFSYIITNTGYGSDYISEAYIYFPTANLDVKNWASTWLSNTHIIVVEGPPGYIWLRYDQQVNLLAGEKDTVTFDFEDTVLAPTSYTLSCEVDNGLGDVETTAVGGSKILEFVDAEIYSYITPNSIDTTTDTNTYTYRIKNEGDEDEYYKVRITVPSIYNNITKVTSSAIGTVNVVPNTSIITLSYTNVAGLDKNETDVVKITAVDSLNSGFSNVSWTADASNTLGFSPVLPTGGQSQDVNFIMPHPDVKTWITPDEIYTTSVSNKLTYKVYNDGTGSNDIFDIVIFVPGAFTNIESVNSSYLTSQTNVRPAGFGNITSITVNYLEDSNPLVTGATDTITIIAYDSRTNLDTTSSWTSHVRNIQNGTNFTTSVAVSKSLTTEFVKPPLTGINPGSIETTTLSNEFTYTINNAGAGGSENLVSAKVYFNTNIFTNVSAIPSGTETISNKGDYLKIDFNPSFPFGVAYNFTIIALDSILVGDTNTIWNAEVDKGDGYKPTDIQGSINVSIQMPDAEADASIEPNQLSTLIVSNDYTCAIINDGKDFNYIKIARITVPSSITNIGTVSSSIALAGDIIKNGNIIDVYYTNGGQFQTGQTDTIIIAGNDDILTNSSFTWEIRVANSIDTNTLVNSAIIPGKSKTVQYTKPDPIAAVYLTPVSISALELTNSYIINVTNKGNSYNYIYNTRISLPGFITNVTSLNSSLIGGAGVDVRFTNNYIYIEYNDASYEFDSGEVDVITFIGWDNITSATSEDIIIDVENGNGSGYLNAGTYPLSVVVPPPDAKGDIIPNIVFTDLTNNIYTCKIANFGSGNNTVNDAVIEFPSGINVTAATSTILTIPANLVISSSSITLHYSAEGASLVTGETDVVIIYCSDTISSENDDFTLSIKVDNGVGTNTEIAVLTPGIKNVNFVRRSSAHITPVIIESESITNDMTYKIINEGFQGAEIFRSKVYIPAGLTVVASSLNSSQLSDMQYITITNFGGTSNWIFIDYKSDPSGDFIKQEIDEITFKLVDSFTKASNLSDWISYIDFDDGYGYFKTDITASKKQQLTVHFTEAKAAAFLTHNDYYYTSTSNSFVYSVSNKGLNSNYITNVRITYDDLKFTAVLDVTSSIPGVSIDTATSGIIDISYAGTKLNAGIKDTITFTLSDNISIVDSSVFDCLVDNDDGSGFVATDINGGSKTANFEKPLDAYIYPNEQDSTISSEYIFSYRINNGGVNTAQRVIIDLPLFITNITYATSSYIINQANIGIGVSSITLYYTNESGLAVDADDLIRFGVIDSLTTGSNSQNITSHVDYGLGYVPAITTAGQSQLVKWKMPNAAAGVYSEPNEIYTTATRSTFTIAVSNAGQDSNDIYRALIVVPAIFTNIGNVTNTYMGNEGNILQGVSTITLDYAGDSKTLATGDVDVITITVDDSVTNNTASYSWQVFVDNNNGKGFRNATIVAGKSLSSVVAFPPTTTISPTNVFATVSSNTFSYKIYNSGAGSSSTVYKLWIDIPDIYTNVIISGGSATNTYYSTISNYILRKYAGINIGGNDTFSITAFDELDMGITNVTWTSYIDKNDGNGFIPTVTGLGTLEVDVNMPDVSASAYISPAEISTVTTSNSFVYVISNEGIGSDRIIQARISIPTNGFTRVTNIQSSLISNDASYARMVGNYIILDYQADNSYIPAQSVDIISFTGIDKIIAEGLQYDWSAEVYNYPTNWQNVIEGSQEWSVEGVIPDYGSKAYVIPNQVESTIDTNHIIKIIIENTGGSGNDIIRAKITIPTSHFSTNGIRTNIRSVFITDDLNTNYISVESNVITIEYINEGTAIAPGQIETNTIRIFDTIPSGSASVTWNVKCEYNSFTGTYIDSGTSTGQSKNLDLVMPDVVLKAWLETPFIYHATNVQTRTLVYKLRNDGTGNNNIFEARIALPPLFDTNVTFAYSVDSTIITNSDYEDEDNGYILLEYHNDGNYLNAGQEDTITIIVYNFFREEAAYGLEFPAEGKNSTSPTWYNAQEESFNWILDIFEKVSYPEAWIDTTGRESADNVIYMVDEDVEIQYFIENKNSTKFITNVRIDFDFSLFTIASITNVITSVITFDTNNKWIEIDYGNNFTPFNGDDYKDEIKIQADVINIFTNATNIPMRCQYLFKNTSIYNYAGDYKDHYQYLDVRDAYWGKLKGSIKQFDVASTIIITYSNTKIQVISSSNLIEGIESPTITSSKPGVGTFDIEIVPGLYSVQVKADEYRSLLYRTNIFITNNTITNIGVIDLKNAIMNEDSVRCIYCYDDAKQSYLCLESGDIFDSFYIDFRILTNVGNEYTDLSDNARFNKVIKDTFGFKLFNFNLKNKDDFDVPGMELNSEGYLTLHYDESFITNQSWSESELAIAYWDEIIGQWITLGGKVDDINDNITLQINYIHNYYTILVPKKGDQPIAQVEFRPNPFTPAAGDLKFKATKLSFLIDKAYDDIKVTMYNMRGEIVREWENLDGSTYSVIIWWDGTDDDSFDVASGVYIVKIDIGDGNPVYGSVLLIK